ncbi:MAG: GNAT family N-acetyltransferase [Tannerellaceae bacterium]|jgi:ribosomal protein S18 acetylase RimI-like enzyme|nr:GNAT family N-acetyltransferase [Tannerellaceae bacterium]
MRGGRISGLWQDCFHDEKAFVRLFFRKLYHCRQAFVIVRKGRIVSSLQLLPYSMTGRDGETPFRLAYIAGCCTHPACRGRGYMRRLLREATGAAKEQGFDVAALIPAEPQLFAYYKAADFTTAYSFGHTAYTVTDLTGADLPDSRILRLDGRNADRFYPFFARHFRRRENCIQLNALQFRAAVADAVLDGGGAYVLQSSVGRRPTALVFVTQPPTTLDRQTMSCSAETLYIKEAMSADEESLRVIIARLLALYRKPSAICRLPANAVEQSSSLVPYGMAISLSERYTIDEQAQGYINLMLD